MFGTAQIVCRYIAEATDNKFLIQPYQAGELAPSRQALDAVSSGSVECAHTPTYFYVAKDPTLGFGTGIPFGLSSRQQQSWWTFGGGAEIVNAALKRLNVVGIPAGLTGAQMGAWFKKEIGSVDDLKGLRWRISGLGGPVLARVGVAPQEIPHIDVYAALEQGTIDAAEFICPHDDEKLGLPKVAKYNYHPCWWESGGMVHLVVNLERWNALPKSYQAIVARACDAASLWMLAKYDAVNAPALKRLIAGRGGAEALPAARHGGVLQGRQRAPRRAGGQGCALQEGARLRQRLPQGAAELAADRRARHRQLHALPARAGLTPASP